MEKITKLNELKNLLSSGAITQGEFEQLKGEIFSSTIQKNQDSGTIQNIKGGKSKWIILTSVLLLVSISTYLFVDNRNNLKTDKNDLAQYELNGNVKYIITNGWRYVDTDEIYGFNKDGFLSYSKIAESEISSIQRDKDNRITISQKYALVGDVGDVYLDGIKRKYNYNTDGKIQSISTEYSTFDKIGSVTTTNFSYDLNGNVIQQITKDENGEQLERITFTLKYDTNDSIIEKIEKSESNVTRVIYVYNDKGLKVRITNYNADGELDSEYKYKYDELGNKIEEEYLFQGVSIWKNKFIYDEENRLVRVDEKTNKTEWRKLYEYSYDYNGNWIKKIHYEENGQESIVTRQIIYYTEEELKSKSEFNFELEFGIKPGESNNQHPKANENFNSYGEIRGRIIGGNLRMLKRELGNPSYTDIGTTFIENTFNSSLPIGLFDLCLNYEVYVYEGYFGSGQNLLVIVSNGKVTNVLPQDDVQDVRDVCCCK